MASSTIARLGEVAAERWGMFTTAQAAQAGISRRALSGLASSGAVLRVAQGVYRIAGAPEQEFEFIYAPWLALGGAERPRSSAGVSPVVAAGETAAIVHGIGDWYPGVRDFIVPERRGTRLQDVRLRIRSLSPAETMFVDGLPTLTVERTVADLIEQWTDRSLVVDAIAQAAEQGKLVSPRRLAEHLEPIAHAQGAESGQGLAGELLEAAGVGGKIARG